MRALEAGADTENVRILAGFSLERRFERALEELGIPRPEPGGVAGEIVSGETSAGEGCHGMCGAAARLFHPEDFHVWMMLDVGRGAEDEVRREARAFLGVPPREYFR